MKNNWENEKVYRLKRVKIFKSDKIKIRCKAKYHRTVTSNQRIYGARLNLIKCLACLRDAFPFQNRWIFGKVPNSLWPPPLIFGKLYCKFFKLASKPSKDGANRNINLGLKLGCTFVLIFINTIVEKHNLKRPLCINFMVK